MPKQITRYQCDFCNRHYSKKYDAAKHGKGCLRNPINKSCSTCANAIYNVDAICDVTGEKIFVKCRTVKHCKDWIAYDYGDDYQ